MDRGFRRRRFADRDFGRRRRERRNPENEYALPPRSRDYSGRRKEEKEEKVLYCKVKFSKLPLEFSEDAFTNAIQVDGIQASERMFKVTKNGEKIAVFRFNSEDDAKKVVEKSKDLQVGNTQIEAKIVSKKTQRGREDRRIRRRHYEGRRSYGRRGMLRSRRDRDFGRYGRRIGGLRRDNMDRIRSFRKRFDLEGGRSRRLRFSGNRRRNMMRGRRVMRRGENNEKRRQRLDSDLKNYMNQQ